MRKSFAKLISLLLISTIAFATDNVILNPVSNQDTVIKVNTGGTVSDALRANATSGRIEVNRITGPAGAALSLGADTGLQMFSNVAVGRNFNIDLSRNPTAGSQTIVQSNDQLGTIFFRGSDGTAFRNAAAIAGWVDGTPGLSDMPGRLTFLTTVDGSTTMAERMRLDNAGNITMAGTNLYVDNANSRVGIGTTSPSTRLHLVTNAASFNTLSLSNTNTTTGNVGNAISLGVPTDTWQMLARNVTGPSSEYVIGRAGIADYLNIQSTGLMTFGSLNGVQRHVINGTALITHNQSGTPTFTLTNTSTNHVYSSYFQNSVGVWDVGVDTTAGTTTGGLASAFYFFGSSLAGSITRAGAWRFNQIGTTASAANAFLDSTSNNNLLRSTSSLRYKQDIKDVTDTESSMVYKLRPITYRSKAEADDKTRRWFGFIAEEVDKVTNMLVNYDEKKRPDGLQYERVTVMLVAEVKKLKKEIDDVKAAHDKDVKDLRGELEALKAQFAALKK